MLPKDGGGLQPLGSGPSDPENKNLPPISPNDSNRPRLVPKTTPARCLLASRSPFTLLDMQMTTLTITERNPVDEQVITGPEVFQGTNITVVEGLKISNRRTEGETLRGLATLFRLGGEDFGRLHQLNNLRLHDGRLHGLSPEPIQVGALVTIGWQDASQSACRGVVAMSLRGSDGWFVTVELDSALAA